MLLKWADVGYEDFVKLGPVVDEFKTLGWMIENVPSSSHGKPVTVGAYLIIHLASKRCYVGSHFNLYARPYQHHSLLSRRKHWLTEFQNAFDAAVDLIVAFIPTIDRDKAYDIEQTILNKFWGTGLLFNRAKDARKAMNNFEVTQETRNKLSVTGKGRPQSPEHIAKRSQALMGHVVSSSAVEKMRNAAIKRGISPDLTKAAAVANSKAITADGVIYKSQLEAANAYGIGSTAVIKRLKSKHFPSWHRAEDIFDRSISVKGIVYPSADTYSKEFNLNVDIVKIRLDSDKDIYADWFYLN